LEKPRIQIEGDGIDLIPLREQHLPMTMAWRNADDVRIWFKNSDAISADQHLQWYAEYSRKLDDFVFVIRERASAALVGQIALYYVDRNRGEAEMGRLIVAPGSEGRGLMKKACRCLINHAMTDLGLGRIYLEVLPSNERAIHLYEKLGFQIVSREKSLLLMSLEKAA